MDGRASNDGKGGHGRQVRHGLKWVTIALVLSQALQLATQIVLARLLAPEVFGPFMLAIAVNGMLIACREIGFGQAYVQREDRDDSDGRLAANTTFYLTFAINLALFAAAFPLAPWIAAFFEKSQGLDSVLRAVFAVLLLDAFLSTPKFVLQKRLEFAKNSFAEIAGAVANTAIAITLAAQGFGVWSLVSGLFGSLIVQTLLLIRLSGWIPRLEFSRRIAGELFSFGKYLWGFSALSTIGGFLDRLVIMRLFGDFAVGIYGKSFYLCNRPATHGTFLVNRITFPVFSRLKEDSGALRAAFVKVLSHVSVVALPLGVGLFAVAGDFVLTLYGARWEAMVPVIEVLAFYGALLAVAAICGPLLKAIGKPHTLLYTGLVQYALLFTLLFLLAKSGIVGIAWAVLLPLVLSSTIGFVLVSRYLDLGWVDITAPMLRSGGSALVMLAAVRTFQHLAELPRAVELAGAIVLGAPVYVLATALLNRALLLEFKQTLVDVVRSRG